MKNTLVWLRNDLRLHDHAALTLAQNRGSEVYLVYVFDLMQWQHTAYGFRKMGVRRAQFLLQSLADLQKRVLELGGKLILRVGQPEVVLPILAQQLEVGRLITHQEVTTEEKQAESLVERAMLKVGVLFDTVWGSTLMHIDDLPFSMGHLPDIFTEFRKRVERETNVRPSLPIPKRLSSQPADIDAGELPTLKQLGYKLDEMAVLQADERAVLPFQGGESEGLARLHDYFWTGDHLRVYKETRNGLLGADYSSKFSPWLALGCLSPRYIYEEIKRYERERTSNDSTYWLVFELLWRDYFRFVAMKYGNALFQLGGIKHSAKRQPTDLGRFWKWASGETASPFVNANMLELSQTGFMSNRGRQNVASYLVHDLKLDWRMGAAWFEHHLLDYDPCSNYGNWNYVAGIGNDPRENRVFNIEKQASQYDPKGEYVRHWLGEGSAMCIFGPQNLNQTKVHVEARHSRSDGPSRPRGHQSY